MRFRRIVRIALAVPLLGWCCALVEAEAADPPAPIPDSSAADIPATGRPAPVGSRPTGILRLLSATQPIPDPQLQDSTGAPLSMSDPGAPEQVQAPPSGPLEWHNPYEFGPAAAADLPIWKRWMPTGMDPWGPRTPLANRSTGKGMPLVITSWLNRPYSAGWFAGGTNGPPLVPGVNQRGGFFGGYRVGWDYDYYWGLEARIAGSELCLAEPEIGRQGVTAGYFVMDANLLYYPWGDSTWRPYVSLGLGLANIGFFDNQDHHYNQTLLGVPIGIGMKYHWTPWFVFRGELVDNLAFGGGIDPLTNLSLTGGIEIRFGGVRRSYWPWNAGRTIW